MVKIVKMIYIIVKMVNIVKMVYQVAKKFEFDKFSLCHNT